MCPSLRVHELQRLITEIVRVGALVVSIPTRARVATQYRLSLTLLVHCVHPYACTSCNWLADTSAVDKCILCPSLRVHELQHVLPSESVTCQVSIPTRARVATDGRNLFEVIVGVSIPTRARVATVPSKHSELSTGYRAVSANLMMAHSFADEHTPFQPLP